MSPFILRRFNTKTNIPKDGEYTTLPRFADPEEAEFALGPIASIAAQRDAVFRNTIIAPQSTSTTAMPPAPGEPHPDLKLRDWTINSLKWIAKEPVAPDPLISPKDLSITEKKILSSRERHEKSHYVLLKSFISANTAYAMLNALMLQRCRKRYLFDCEKNREILIDDPWLQDVWLWIEGSLDCVASIVPCSPKTTGAENIAKDDGMVSGSLDLSYMGVCSIWKNDLGKSSLHLQSHSTNAPREQV